MKDIAIYSNIDSWTATDFVTALNDAERFGEDIRVRISTDGGEVAQGWAMLARLQDFKGNKSVVVDGKAYSMGAFMCLYSDNVEALDVSQFMLHRAGYPEWYEKSEWFTPELKKNLDSMNASLKAKMKSKLDAAAFKEVTGITIDKIFSDERPDVFLTAKEAKKIGLISSIRTLDSVARNEVNAICKQFNVAAMYEPMAEQPEQPSKSINNNMTIAELRTQHPALVAQIEQDAASATLQNVNAWLAYKDIDQSAVMAGIGSGKAPNQADVAKMQAAFITAQSNLKTAEETAAPTAGAETPETGEGNEPVDAKARLKAELEALNKK